MTKNTDKSFKPIKKYLLLTTGFPPAAGGIAEYVYNFVKCLDGEVTVLTMDGHLSVELSSLYEGLCRFKIIRLGVLKVRPAWLRDLIFLMTSVYLTCLGRYDKLICGHLQLGAAALFLKKVFGLAYTLILHGSEVILLGDSGSSLKLKRAINESLSVVAVSQYTRQALIERMGNIRPIELIPPMLNEELLAHALQDGAQLSALLGGKILLTVGRLDLAARHKGHDLVLMALPDVLKHHPDLIYRIVGDGDAKAALRDLASSLKIADHVIFYPFDRAELHRHYQQCSVFIMPSRQVNAAGPFEGFGIVFLEAALFKKPVIAGRSGGVADAVIDDETGKLVDPCDPAAIALAINSLLDDPSYGRRLGEAGHHRALAEFSLRTLAPRIRRCVDGDADA